MNNFTDERIAECKARCEAAQQLISDLCQRKREWIMSIPARPDYDPDLVLSRALSNLPDALDALVEARRERDELQARVDSWHEPPLLDVHAICDQRDKAIQERDEAEALLLRLHVGNSQAEIDSMIQDTTSLLRKRGLLEGDQ